MPFVELISFIAFDALHEDLAREDSPLRHIGSSEGCIDIVQGRQIENSDRIYFITTWKTYDLYDKAARGRAYASFMAYLIHHATSDPSVQHFEIDGDPHQALSAPVTEVVLLKSKAADWRWDQELYAGIMGAKKGLPLVEGSHPPLRWGEVKDVNNSACYCMLVGWDSVKAHFRAAREKPLERHIKKISQTTSLIDARHVIFKSLLHTNDEHYFPERMGGLRMQSSL